MIARFSLYDFIAVVVPGIFSIWAVTSFLGLAIPGGVRPVTGDLAETSILIVVGYVVGLLLQGVSQKFTEWLLLKAWGGFPSSRWLLVGDDHFSAEYRRELADALQKRFGIPLPTERPSKGTRRQLLNRNQEIFYLCYRSAETANPLPETFNAQYGLFRNLLTMFALLGVLGVARVIQSCVARGEMDWTSATLAGACLIAGTISYWRIAKRADDFAKSVYDLFLANVKRPASLA